MAGAIKINIKRPGGEVSRGLVGVRIGTIRVLLRA